MNKFTPHACLHVHLERFEHWPEMFADSGSYIVIWWKSIPLGELYTKPDAINTTRPDTLILPAITPALKHYGATDVALRSIAGVIEFCRAFFDKEEQLPGQVPLSLIICTRDRAERLQVCLSSLRKLRCKPSEIIVVDNATRDDSTFRVSSLFPEVVYIREDRPGLDIARNTGARKASAPIVAYTDDDTMIHPDWIWQTWKTFDDPAVRAMTGLVLAAELRTEAQWIFERHWPFNRGFVDKRYDDRFFSGTLPSGPPVWNIGAGANMAFRKSAFAECGLFDERLDVGAAGCNGDSEMWYRILASGGAIGYNPRAVVFHVHRDTLEGLRSQIFSYMRGFTTAILVQHQRFGHRGNLKHLFLDLPKYYAFLVARGFPRYRDRFTTIFQEMAGIFSGLIFYLKNRNTPSNSQ